MQQASSDKAIFSNFHGGGTHKSMENPFSFPSGSIWTSIFVWNNALGATINFLLVLMATVPVGVLPGIQYCKKQAEYITLYIYIQFETYFNLPCRRSLIIGGVRQGINQLLNLDSIFRAASVQKKCILVDAVEGFVGRIISW